MIFPKPISTNNLSSKGKNFNKEIYNIFLNNILQINNLTFDNFFRSSDKHLFYGRIDDLGNINNPISKYLKIIPNTNSQYAFNFVCDAFESLLYSLNSANNTRNLKDKRFLNLKPIKGWSDLDNKYEKYITEIFNLYSKDLNSFSDRKNKVIDFNSFLKDFVRYIDVSLNKLPMLKSDFIVSNKCGVLDTGLAIELFVIDKDDDNTKVEQFWNNPEFFQFIEVCRLHGFLIDKECPWRIVFDINSEYAVKYMSKYNIDKSDIFTKYFVNTETDDISNLKKHVLFFYNKLSEKQRDIQLPYLENGNIKYKNFVRNSLKEKNLDLKYDNLFWFRLYCHINFIREKSKLSQEQYNKNIIILQNIFKKSPEQAISELNSMIDASGKSDIVRFRFVV